MSNFPQTFLEGKAGRNFGRDTGIPNLNRAINGIQKKNTYGIAAAPKCGKTTLTDFIILSMYLEALANGEINGKKDVDNLHIIYFSLEIDRISKEFKFAAFFMAYDYKIMNFKHRDIIYEMSGDYLSGKLLHYYIDNGIEKKEFVPVSVDHEEKLKNIYIHRIAPLFGEYDEKGVRVSTGVIDLVEDNDNPTGLDKYVRSYAASHGKFNTQKYMSIDDNGNPVEKTRIVSYVPDNPDEFVLIVTDHIRKPRRERGFSMKENIDKWLEYSTVTRNMCYYSYFHVVHSNRGISNVERLKFHGENIFPTADDVKDSGNLAEECTVLMTMFNANDEKYNLTVHMGVPLVTHKRYRSLHITEARNVECPIHIQFNMYGAYNMFGKLYPTN